MYPSSMACLKIVKVMHQASCETTRTEQSWPAASLLHSMHDESNGASNHQASLQLLQARKGLHRHFIEPGIIQKVGLMLTHAFHESRQCSSCADASALPDLIQASMPPGGGRKL
jgi:hypothetical protein